MAKEYLERLTALLREATSGRFGSIKLEYKHFFSGAALYANGKICISLTPAGFAIKLPEELRNDLLKQKGTNPLQYFPERAVKKGYVVLPKAVLDDREVLRDWVKVSIEYVTSLNG